MVPRSDMTSPDSRKSVDSLPLSSPKSAASQKTPFQQADSNSKSVSRHRLGSRRSSNASSITSLGSTFHPPLLQQQHQQHGSIAEAGQNGRIYCIRYPAQLRYAYVNDYLHRQQSQPSYNLQLSALAFFLIRLLHPVVINHLQLAIYLRSP